jgi:hypothetical protein
MFCEILEPLVELQMVMDQRHFLSSWTEFLTLSSTELQEGFPLRALIFATTLPSSHCISLVDLFTTTFIFFMGYLWNANRQNGSVPLKFFQNRTK